MESQSCLPALNSVPDPCPPLHPQGASIRERLVAAGGVQQSLVDAFRAVLEDPHLDGRCGVTASL